MALTDSKLQQMVFPKKIFLIHTDNFSRKVCGFSKDPTSKQLAEEIFDDTNQDCYDTYDEIYDTYVDFYDDLELYINTYNMLIRKTGC